jgi:hypothetical protein
MATYYVDGNAGNDGADGSSNRPWKTLDKAVGQLSPGDEVRVRTATYHEALRIKTDNTTWRADTGHKPVIDGHYHDGLFNNQGKLPHPDGTGNFLPQASAGSIVVMNANGATLDGFTIQNVAGSAVSVSASNCTVRNCRIDFIYNTAVKSNISSGFIENVVFENNICTRISVRYYDPLRGGGVEGVSGVMKMGRTRDGIIRNNVCAYGHGEGMNIGKDSYRILVEGNVVHTCSHVHLYINRSQDVTMRNNLVYHLYTPDLIGEDGRAPAGIAIGDEDAFIGQWIHSSGGQIYNNIVVGLGTLLAVRNNKDGYDTQMDGCYIGYNTFVAREKTRVAIGLVGNMAGRPHRNSIFENNLIYGAPLVNNTSGDLSGILFRNNLWSAQPEAALRGDGDRIGDPNLVNVAAALRDNFPNPESNLDLNNYRLTERSALAIGRASNGSRANGLQPPEIRKDFFGSNRDGQPDIGAHEYDGVPVAITANFSIGPGQAAGVVPHVVDFTDKSTTDRPIVARLWDFGDGQTSTETNPSHSYETAGTFDVTLTVTDDKGNSDSLTRSDLIAVTEEEEFVVAQPFRRFMLVQREPETALAYGTQFPDLSCVMLWHAEPFHILTFASIEDATRILQTEDIELRWVDPSDDGEAAPIDVDDEELEAVR